MLQRRAFAAGQRADNNLGTVFADQCLRAGLNRFRRAVAGLKNQLHRLAVGVAIEFGQRQLGAAFGIQAVLGLGPGHRREDADLDGFFCSRCAGGEHAA